MKKISKVVMGLVLFLALSGLTACEQAQQAAEQAKEQARQAAEQAAQQAAEQAQQAIDQAKEAAGIATPTEEAPPAESPEGTPAGGGGR